MTCAEHLWWFDAPCPKCHHRLKPGEWEKIAAVETAAVTAAVTVSPDEPELPPSERTADELDIPPFLRRAQFFPTPAAADFTKTVSPPAPPTRREDHTQWSDAMLHEQLNHPELSLVARQPIYRELQRRQDLAKARAHFAKLKASKAAAVAPEKQDWEK